MQRIGAAMQELGTGALAGALAGALVGGVGGRVVMRLSGIAAGPDLVGVPTSNGNLVGDITFVGTLGLVIFAGIFAGIVGGALYAVLRPWLIWARAWRGVAFGLVLLAALGSLVLQPNNFDFRLFGPSLLNVSMFATLFPLFGAALVPMHDGIARAATGARTGDRIAQALVLLVWMAGLVAVLFLGMLAVTTLQIVFAASSTEAGDQVVTVIVFSLIVTAVVARWFRAVSVPTYVLLAVPVLAGGVRTLSGVAEMLAP